MNTNQTNTQLYLGVEAAGPLPNLNAGHLVKMDTSAVAQRRQYGRDHYRNNREVYLARMRARRRNPETARKIAEATRIYQQTAKYKQRRKELYRRHSEKIKAKQRKFSVSEEGKKYQSVYKSRRRRENPQVKLMEWLRTFVNRALWNVGAKKRFRRIEMVGCTLAELKSHLESQFESWMNWQNRDKWHVDHIVPIKAFDLTNTDEQKWCFYYKNLRPLERSLNQAKSGSVSLPLPSWLPPHISERILNRQQKSFLTGMA